MLKKLFYLSLGIAGSLFIAAAVYYGMILFREPAARPLLSLSSFEGVSNQIFIRDDNFIREEYEYLCGDIYIVYLGKPADDLTGITYNKLRNRYPAEDGWSVEKIEKTVVLRKKCNEFCPEHKTYRHLGIAEGRLAIYQGPLGCNKELLKTENLTVENLPVKFQIKLEQAMAFEKQETDVQDQLRKELEFSSESSLQAGLENLDESIIDF
ncbi:MAG: hypothetical protein XD78_1206 [Desulfotomaculum sp. 46_296]|nr:MAG: hypothetical protein XD78_1206 [Desulfotomaculum sp. 46_296]HAU31325.1 hypothetical protein [Desulfotomaculum sp.]